MTRRRPPSSRSHPARDGRSGAQSAVPRPYTRNDNPARADPRLDRNRLLTYNQAMAAVEQLEELRTTEFGRLDACGEVYLDYTGAGLYAQSQIDAHVALLRDSVFGNPHSVNPTSAAMTERVEQARAAVLAFFSASPDEYEAIFTPNATGA